MGIFVLETSGVFFPLCPALGALPCEGDSRETPSCDIASGGWVVEVFSGDCHGVSPGQDQLASQSNLGPRTCASVDRFRLGTDQDRPGVS